MKLRTEEIVRQKEEIEQQAQELAVINDQKTKLFSMSKAKIVTDLQKLARVLLYYHQIGQLFSKIKHLHWKKLLLCLGILITYWLKVLNGLIYQEFALLEMC